MSDQAVTDEEIKIAFAHANFGHDKHRTLLEVSVLKKLVGYHCGHTITTIMKELGLIGKNETVTEKGKRFVAHAFRHLMIIGG